MKGISILFALKRSKFSQLLLIAAGLMLYIFPSLDSIAHSAATAVDAGSTSQIVRVASAFDVLDDALDYLPTNKSPADVHQHVFQLSLPDERRISTGSNIGIPLAWNDSLRSFIAQSSQTGLLRPPQV